MGGSKDKNDPHSDPDAHDWELGLTTKYKVKHPFYIARYPITNAQFDAFLQAQDGFTNSDWWNGLAKTDNTSPPPKEGGVFDLPNHPVINVTWYQAVAFTRWLNQFLRSANLQVWARDGIKTAQSMVNRAASYGVVRSTVL